MNNIKGWEIILKNGDKVLSCHPNEATKTLVDELARKYKNLDDVNKFIWLSSGALQSVLLNSEVVKLLIIMHNKNIISDLYLPIKIIKNTDGVSIQGSKLYFDPEYMLDDFLNQPTKFIKQFGKLKIKQRFAFLKIKNDVYERLGLPRIEKTTLIPRIKFDQENGILSYKDKTKKFIRNSNQFVLANLLFNAPPNTDFDEDDLHNKMPKAQSMRAPYYAMLGINKIIKDAFDLKPPLKIKDSVIWREETDI